MKIIQTCLLPYLLAPIKIATRNFARGKNRYTGITGMIFPVYWYRKFLISNIPKHSLIALFTLLVAMYPVHPCFIRGVTKDIGGVYGNHVAAYHWKSYGTYGLSFVEVFL